MGAWGDFNRNLVADMRAHKGNATAGPFVGREVLILTTKGARTGEVRDTPIVYTRDGDAYIIVASKGGAPTHPSWYHNLVAHPDVTVEVAGEKFKARARVIEGDDYERLYHRHASINPSFNAYRRRTSRRIPVIALKRVRAA